MKETTASSVADARGVGILATAYIKGVSPRFAKEV